MTNENIINHIHTLLWEYTANYVETSEDSKTKLYTIAVENNFSRYNSNCGDTIEQLEITDCDDFDDMNKPQLFEYFDIIKDIDLHFEDVEYMGE